MCVLVSFCQRAHAQLSCASLKQLLLQHIYEQAHTHTATSLLHKQTTCYCAPILHQTSLAAPDPAQHKSQTHGAWQHTSMSPAPALRGWGCQAQCVAAFVCYCTPRGNVQAAELGQYSPGSMGTHTLWGAHTGDYVPVTEQKGGGM